MIQVNTVKRLHFAKEIYICKETYTKKASFQDCELTETFLMPSFLGTHNLVYEIPWPSGIPERECFTLLLLRHDEWHAGEKSTLACKNEGV